MAGHPRSGSLLGQPGPARHRRPIPHPAVEGPDEQNWPVDDSVYTNATAAKTLWLAIRVGQMLGEPVPARWRTVASGLVVLRAVPLGGLPAVRPEFRSTPGSRSTGRRRAADLPVVPEPGNRGGSVGPRVLHAAVRPRGPAMTDRVNSIVAAQLGTDCAA